MGSRNQSRSIGDQSSLRIARERLLAPVPVIVGFQAGLGRTEPRVRFFQSIHPRVRRNKDGGFGAAARVEPVTASGAPWAPSRRVTELQERQAMTQTLEPGTKASTAKGKRTGGDGPQTTNAEHRPLGIGVPASRSATAPHPTHGGMSCGCSKSQAPQRLFFSLPSLRL